MASPRREGLPAADGESLAKSVSLDVFVRDRSPSVRFLGSAYVLPAGGDPTIPVVTVNTNRVNAALYRIGDRQLADAIADGTFLSQLSQWETDTVEERTGEKVWDGSVDVANEVNREMTTAIPVGELQSDLKPGAYILAARAVNDTSSEWEAKATQWFVVTDLGLTTLAGNDGLNVFVRSLGTAGPVGDVALRLVAVNNEVLGEATTDADGFARFAPGLMRGTGGMAPGLLVAADGGRRLQLPRPLQGADGPDRPRRGGARPAASRSTCSSPPSAASTAPARRSTPRRWCATTRRDAVENVPLTAILTRPDGKEARRVALADQGLGGNVTPFDLTDDAMRGTWRIAVHADVKAPPLAETTFLVEDFEPEQLDFDLTTDRGSARLRREPAELSLDARFLYGAPAANLSVEGETALSAVRDLTSYPGYVFGLADETFNTVVEPLASAETDDSGHASVEVQLPDGAVSSLPLQAKVNVRVLDSGGRPVERSIELPVGATSDRLGIKPLFEGDAAENSNVGFELIAVDPQGERTAERNIRLVAL